MPAFDIHVNRKNFHEHKIVEKNTPTTDDLLEGQILMKIDQFAFTSNNITYAAVGEVVGYWKFFPVSDEWGIIPMWGFAEVVASKNENVAVGERFYGYYPMGSHLIMSPVKVKPTNFTDGIAHRQTLPVIYNNYINVKADPSYSKKREAIQSLFRPLFTTSFLIDDFMDDNDFFGGEQVMLTSASSKTAIGLAFLLAQRKGMRNLNIIGLTSASNVDFVKSLGYYDTVWSYDQVGQIDNNRKSIIVDFSGNEQLQANLQSHLGEHLVYNCLVGMVDWTQRGGKGSAAQNGTFFFAPTQAVKRNKEWGVAGFQQKLGMAWLQFTNQIGDWMTVKTTEGAQGLADLYLPMLNGKIDPKVGHIVTGLD
ncbi:MAG: DUF2855 family protein [Bacteroidota bacterium]